MDDKDVLERLLEVLNRIDGRLKSIESSVATTKAAAPEEVEEGIALPRGENDQQVLPESADIVEDERDLGRVALAVEEVPVAHNASSQKGKGIERPTQPETGLKPSSTEPSKNVQTLDLPPTAPISDPEVEPHGESSSSIHQPDHLSYSAHYRHKSSIRATWRRLTNSFRYWDSRTGGWDPPRRPNRPG